MTDWRSRDEGRLGVGVVAFAVATLVAVVSWAGGLNASFQNSRFDCPDDPSVVACWKSDVTGANALIDFSGANNMTYTEDFSNAAWTKTNVTVTADQARGPDSWTANADLLTPTAADSHVYQDDAGAAAGETHTCSWDIRSVTGNVDLSIHVYSETHTAIRGTEAITVTPHWRRYSVQGVLAAGDADIGCTIGGNTTWSTGENIYAVRASSQENDEWRTGMGIYYPVLATTTKPALDLAHANSPTGARTHLQTQGNKGPAREYDGVNQDYRLAHDPAINIFDTSHTMTFAVLQDVGAAGSDRLFDHQAGTGGMDIYSNALANWRATYTAAGGGTIDVDCPVGATNDGMLHFIQVVRDGNDVTCHLDGTAGTTVDVTGYGDDVAAVIYLGSENANYLDGQLSYTCLRSRALSLDERAEEREMLWGTYTNWSKVNAWQFSRSTVSYKTFSNAYENTYPSHSMDLVAVDHPRVAGRGGGLLIEGQTTQLYGFTEAFGSWTQVGVCAVTANNYVAPNGTATADELDNTGGANTDSRSVQSADLGDLTGRVFTSSVRIRAATPHNCTVALVEHEVAVARQIFYVTNEWQRFSVQRACAGGGTNRLSLQVLPGEHAVATGTAHFWAANLTETTFPTSYIPNAGAATSQVTRTADDMTIDPHPAGVNEYILPEIFAPNTNADKLTVYLEVRCAFSSSADNGGIERRLFEISGNAGVSAFNRNRFRAVVDNNGRLHASVFDDSSTERRLRTGVDPVDFSEWFSIRAFFDFTDLSRMDMWVRQIGDAESNAGTTYNNNAGTATFDTTDNLIRLGQTFNGTTIDSFCRVRNFRINNREIRAP